MCRWPALLEQCGVPHASSVQRTSDKAQSGEGAHGLQARRMTEGASKPSAQTADASGCMSASAAGARMLVQGPMRNVHRICFENAFVDADVHDGQASGEDRSVKQQQKKKGKDSTRSRSSIQGSSNGGEGKRGVSAYIGGCPWSTLTVARWCLMWPQSWGHAPVRLLRSRPDVHSKQPCVHASECT